MHQTHHVGMLKGSSNSGSFSARTFGFNWSTFAAMWSPRNTRGRLRKVDERVENNVVLQSAIKGHKTVDLFLPTTITGV